MVFLAVGGSSQLDNGKHQILGAVISASSVTELRDQYGRDGVEVGGRLPETVLVVLKALGEGAKDAGAEGLEDVVTGRGRRKILNSRVDNVRGVRGNDGLEVLEEVLQEAVGADLALGLADRVRLG